MANPCLAVVKFQALTGVPSDAIENTFAFSDYDTGIFGALEDFYNHANTHQALGAYLAQTVSRAANTASVDIYDLTGHLDGSPHGVPIETDRWNLTTASAFSSVPAECAATISFHSEITYVGRQAARQRGRIYFGPIDGNISVTHDSTTHELLLSSDFMEDIGVAASRLLAACGANNPSKPTPWSVWSRADAAMHSIVAGWVDNRIDSQRRRETAATVRNIWS